MIFDPQRLIESFFAGSQARWDALNHPVERAVVEESTAVPVFAAQGADDSVHGRFVAVVRPALLLWALVWFEVWVCLMECFGGGAYVRIRSPMFTT